jgi:hypothetical protein
MHNGHLPHSNANQNRSIQEVSVSRRLWDARSAIIFVYLFRFAFAFSLAWPFVSQLDISSYQHPGTAQTDGGQSVLLYIESVRLLIPTIHEQRLSAIGITLLYLLLIPLVSMIWIHAIDEHRTLRTSVIKAARCYHASLLIYLFFLFVLVTSVALFFGLGWSVHRGLWFILNDRIRDTFGFAVVLPASLSILYLFVCADTARTALCLDRRASSAIRLGLTAAFRTTSIFAYLFWFGSAALLTSGSALFFVFQEDGFKQSFFSTFILLETVAFARIILRGRWLVTARNIVYRIDKRSVENAIVREN